jgi:hypothetical protein
MPSWLMIFLKTGVDLCWLASKWRQSSMLALPCQHYRSHRLETMEVTEGSLLLLPVTAGLLLSKQISATTKHGRTVHIFTSMLLFLGLRCMQGSILQPCQCYSHCSS